jgi:hypothetical protein
MTARYLIVLLLLAAGAATAALSQRGATPTGQPAADTEVPRIVIVGHREQAE